MALARKAHPELSFPQSLWEKDWVVYCKPAPQGGKKVLRYLGRYGGTGRILEVSKDLRGVRSTVRPGKVA
jgi:hypothetical protein